MGGSAARTPPIFPPLIEMIQDNERHAKRQRAFQENNLGIKINTRIGGYSMTSIVRIPAKVNCTPACFQNCIPIVKVA